MRSCASDSCLPRRTKSWRGFSCFTYSIAVNGSATDEERRRELNNQTRTQGIRGAKSYHVGSGSRFHIAPPTDGLSGYTTPPSHPPRRHTLSPAGLQDRDLETQHCDLTAHGRPPASRNVCSRRQNIKTAALFGVLRK